MDRLSAAAKRVTQASEGCLPLPGITSDCDVCGQRARRSKARGEREKVRERVREKAQRRSRSSLGWGVVGTAEVCEKGKSRLSSPEGPGRGTCVGRGRGYVSVPTHCAYAQLSAKHGSACLRHAYILLISPGCPALTALCLRANSLSSLFFSPHLREVAGRHPRAD
ncbi:hypothetical protein BDY21DRAFT_118987 [Lineolata rhizophorae]|uniref:Uncharacterized protein n=1 Tax=Lineolata rhizophorae TaxID=578093 RepID=A0A6A6NQD7_9PEZI|nr:hypothetical protein BDY21DRAFT_118987 [Lineolata rhizophorae]